MRLAGLAVAAVLLAFPATAGAAAFGSVSPVGDAFVYTGDATQDDGLSVESGQDNQGTPGYWFRPLDAGTVINMGCEQPAGPSGRVCTPDIAQNHIVVDLRGGNDVATAQFLGSMAPSALPITLNGGAGNDDILGGPLADALNGNDGNDVLRLMTGGDTLSGGAGVDVAALAFPGPATVTLDGVPNDGPANANVKADVEIVNGTPNGDSLTGSNAANSLHGLAGADTLNGLGGADVLDGGADNDTIHARDRAVDTVLCGSGTDTANVDFNDVVAADCETINRTPPPIVDADGDGSLPPDDCDDANPNIHPGARDKPKNGVDEDCSGKDANFRRNRTSISTGWLSYTGYTLVTRLTFSSLPARAKVRLRCKGGGCPFSTKSLKVRKRKASATKLLKSHRLSPGAVLEIRVTAPGTMGKVVRYTIRSHALPKRRQLCLRPGKKKPGKCA